MHSGNAPWNTFLRYISCTIETVNFWVRRLPLTSCVVIETGREYTPTATHFFVYRIHMYFLLLVKLNYTYRTHNKHQASRKIKNKISLLTLIWLSAQRDQKQERGVSVKHVEDDILPGDFVSLQSAILVLIFGDLYIHICYTPYNKKGCIIYFNFSYCCMLVLQIMNFVIKWYFIL